MRSADSTEFFTDVLSGVKVQLADHSIVGRKQLSETLKLCTYGNWATTPVGYCQSTASFSLRPYCRNARRDRCQNYHNCFPFGELEETTSSSNYSV